MYLFRGHAFLNVFFHTSKDIVPHELDKLLRLDMVPPAVEREVKGDTGAAVMWIDGVKSVKESGGKVPAGPA